MNKKLNILNIINLPLNIRFFKIFVSFNFNLLKLLNNIKKFII